ncbi:hypothetical protein [Streptomyces sp. SLBN-134]|uniref:hypothetical protein n=1 Tax=Streptomyces sp. SLBN-134 TaxID=2768456 RepID=UPI00116A1482|nr:hypothetical protein [Streptomyces sp. SLBN-134]TQL18156.1 hypothetical protein FBY37_0037 [Streptomyces sp. SLBN-134]
MNILEMVRPVRGTGHLFDVLDVLHRDRLALRVHDGAFSAMDPTTRSSTSSATWSHAASIG